MKIHRSIIAALTILLLILSTSMITGKGVITYLNDSGEGGGAGEEGGTLLALDETFDSIRNGVRLIMSYDAASQSFIGTVENTTTQTIQAVRVEVHLSNGVELGPTPSGDLAPGETRAVILSAAGTSGYDGWVPHAESGASGAPCPPSGEGSEGAGGEHGSGGEGAGGEGGGEGSEGSSGAGEEGGMALALDETFDTIRNGVRLVMSYDAATNLFSGTAENTTNQVIQAVRVEIHLSNGIELGPTTPTDLQPGESIPVELAGSSQPFDGWTPHAESGPIGADAGAESGGGEGGGGEHGAGSSEGADGEHGSGGESGSGS